MRKLEGAVECQEALGRRVFLYEAVWEKRNPGATVDRLDERRRHDALVHVDHSIGISVIAAGRAAIVRVVRVDHDDSAWNGRPHLAARRERVGAGLDDTHGIAFVGMTRVSMHTGVRL